MARVEFLLPSGEIRTIESGKFAETLMAIGKRAGVPGIIGDCGGFMACGTCHVYVDAAWREKVGPPASAEEIEILEMTDSAKPESRLGCQIWVSEDLDGLRVSPAGA